MSCTIFVDADSCPSQAKNIVLRAGIRRNLNIVYVANRKIPFSMESPLFKMVVVENKEGAADDYIVENVTDKDLVITRDIPLAKRLIDKNVITINDRGTYFDRENVERMLRQRELSMQMAALGLHTGMSYSTYSNKDVQKFASCFEKACMEMLKRQSSL